ETLSRSCGIAGLTIFKEPRSYSSLSRSQQRPIATGSRIAATAGTGIVHESSDCSGNSAHDDTPKQSTSLIEHLNVDSTRVNEEKNVGEKSGTEVVSKEDARSKGSRKPKRYAAVTISSNGGEQPGKKWWRLLKWFPGFKSLKLAGRGTYAVTERAQVRREEISMAMWNETDEQHSV
ncbi:unnamed protein product, partial [Heterotrigona itama]